MFGQCLVCITINNEQCCITHVIHSIQQPVFTVSLRSINNPLARLALFSQLLWLTLRKGYNVSFTLREQWIVLSKNYETEMAVITGEYTRSRKHIMLSIRKREFSVLNAQTTININCSHSTCTIKRNCKKIAPWQLPDNQFFSFLFSFLVVP